MAIVNVNDINNEPRELIEGFIAGYPEETERLIALYYTRVYLNCIKLLRNADDSEDAVQETFIRAIKYKGSYDKKRTFLFWLLKISTNLCLDILKKNKRELIQTVRIEVLNAEVDGLKDFRDSIVDYKAQRDIEDWPVRELIKNAIDLLPVAYRATVSLRYYNEMTCEDIASILETPVGTIKFRLSRARAYLDGLLKTIKE